MALTHQVKLAYPDTVQGVDWNVINDDGNVFVKGITFEPDLGLIDSFKEQGDQAETDEITNASISDKEKLDALWAKMVEGDDSKVQALQTKQAAVRTSLTRPA